MSSKGIPQHPEKWEKLATLPIKPGGRTLREIAAHIGVSNQAVQWVENQALTKLKRALKKVMSEEDMQSIYRNSHCLGELPFSGDRVRDDRFKEPQINWTTMLYHLRKYERENGYTL